MFWGKLEAMVGVSLRGEQPLLPVLLPPSVHLPGNVVGMLAPANTLGAPAPAWLAELAELLLFP